MKESFQEQIDRAIRKIRNNKNMPADEKKLAINYYNEKRQNTSALASWESFKGSWAGQEWIKKHG